MLSSGGALLVYVGLRYFSSAHAGGISLTVFGVFLTGLFFAYRLHTVTVEKLLRYIDTNYPSLEDSADLLVASNVSLTRLQKIQQEKVKTEFSHIAPSIRFPHRLPVAALFLFIAVSLAMFLPAVKTGTTTSGVVEPSPSDHTTRIQVPAAIEKLTIEITPPRYTGINSSVQSNPELTLVEGSSARWAIQVTDGIGKMNIVFTGNDTVELTRDNKIFSFKTVLDQPAFYQFIWEVGNQKRSSDYYKIEIIRDKAPEVVLHNLNQFTELSLEDNLSIPVKATIRDDYGIRNTYLIATVTKGSGESVKFREEKLAFTSPAKPKGRHVDAARIIDLRKLGLEPGDELYFYAEAWDTKTPAPNRTRTETYFLTLKDTASQNTYVEGGLGVDLMPEYFRSQRQIIIDTEKLLATRKTMAKKEFNSRSNELGYDQKVLRLRYGEFLGEEFQSGIGPQGSLEHDDHDDDEDITSKYGHQHDTENEHNHVPEKPAQPSVHQHDHGQDTDGENKNPLHEFLHSHDNAEEATFFMHSIRVKLKAALAVMWDAELHLRLFEPEKSLPFQYKALKLLKEISNESRIYVHKTGFDPPPIKEEKRLSGDLDEATSSRVFNDALRVRAFPAIRRALPLTSSLLSKHPIVLSAHAKQMLREAGNELASVALEKPQFLPALTAIKIVTEENIRQQQEVKTKLETIQKSFYQALPQETKVPSARRSASVVLDQYFTEQLKKERND